MREPDAFEHAYAEKHPEPSSSSVVLTVDKIDVETEKAIGVKDTRGIVQYLPKSQIEIVRGKNQIAIHVPKWLADKKDNLEFRET